MVFSALACVFVILFGRPMTALFVGAGEKEVIDASQTYLVLNGIFYLVLGLLFIFRNTLQGMGYGLLPMTAGIAELVGRSGASLIASHFGSYMGICLASPAAWVLAGTLLLIMYFEIMKGKKDRNLKNR